MSVENRSSEEQYRMPLYRLKQDIPLASAGTIFYYDRNDSTRGSPAEGCLKLAWTKDGGCQNALCAGTIVFHANARHSKEWFGLIQNEIYEQYILSGVSFNNEPLYKKIK